MLNVLNKELVKKINEPIDPALIRKNYSGEKYMTGYSIVRLLNEITNGAWDFTIDEKWKEDVTVKNKKNQDEIRPVYHMTVTLRCLFDDGNGNVIEIKKPGTAGKVLESGSKNASNIYKSLETLCVRKAASYFGVGAELWLNEDEIGYFDEPIWTEELLQDYQNEWDIIDKIKKDFNLSDEDLNGIVSEWNNYYARVDLIPPSDIEAFTAFLQQQLSEE
nr:MAG TPA: hypothetical protein [Caudoviricetes sp.]